jgi:hypothetical protein
VQSGGGVCCCCWLKSAHQRPGLRAPGLAQLPAPAAAAVLLLVGVLVLLLPLLSDTSRIAAKRQLPQHPQGGPTITGATGKGHLLLSAPTEAVHGNMGPCAGQGGYVLLLQMPSSQQHHADKPDDMMIPVQALKAGANSKRCLGALKAHRKARQAA